jgi:hypothetical protein
VFDFRIAESVLAPARARHRLLWLAGLVDRSLMPARLAASAGAADLAACGRGITGLYAAWRGRRLERVRLAEAEHGDDEQPNDGLRAPAAHGSRTWAAGLARRPDAFVWPVLCCVPREDTERSGAMLRMETLFGVLPQVRAGVSRPRAND